LNDKTIELKVAAPSEVKVAIEGLRAVDMGHMLDCTLEMPRQIMNAIQVSAEFNEGDLPLDHTRVHLVGMGGSAITGDLLWDMMNPKNVIEVHRGVLPPRDRCGVILSSYSGNTSEILELSRMVVGGLRTVAVVTSGGALEAMAWESGLPVWKMPAGYQPRAAVGWSLGFLVCLMERWRVLNAVVKKLEHAAHRLAGSLEQGELSDHPLIRAALPIADLLSGHNGVIFHSFRCVGAAHRLAAQISENSKQPTFTAALPESSHNTVEGIAGADPSKWTLVFMSDPGDTPSLREALNRALQHFSGLGFDCVQFPAAGDGPFELTLSRLVIAEFVSLFLAAKSGVDPTPIRFISNLKEGRSNPNPENAGLVSN